jgi:N-acylneuraminate cytidylyltransferase
MKILALIPARGGSKRLPGKNIRLLGGKPLIAWSIDVAKNIPEICDILVSTDDTTIADIAQNKEALVPWLRPSELATDTASSVDVVIHALDWYEGEYGVVDGLLLLQPTSPFRSRETLVQAIRLFDENLGKSVISVSPASCHPLWCFEIQDQFLSPFVGQGGMNLRSQDLPPAYVVNGSLYLVNPKILRSQHSLFGVSMLPLLVDRPEQAIDIDTEWDWKIAEAALIPAVSSNK